MQVHIVPPSAVIGVPFSVSVTVRRTSGASVVPGTLLTVTLRNSGNAVVASQQVTVNAAGVPVTAPTFTVSTACTYSVQVSFPGNSCEAATSNSVLFPVSNAQPTALTAVSVTAVWCAHHFVGHSDGQRLAGRVADRLVRAEWSDSVQRHHQRRRCGHVCVHCAVR